MVDEIFDRTYQAGRGQLNAGIERGLSRLARSIGDTFRALNRIEFDAPWQRESKDVGCA